jgi:hypothetical protein
MCRLPSPPAQPPAQHAAGCPRLLPWLVAGLVAGLVALLPAGPLQAQDGGVKPVYRCPGPPVLYTDALSPQEARDKGCRTIEGAPVTVVQVPRPRPAGPPSAAGSAAPAPDAQRNSQERVDPAAQRARDTDARRILGEELQREEERLAQMRREYNNGEPERRGDERNFQRYADRVAEMKAAIARKESDIAAIKRELSKLPS